MVVWNFVSTLTFRQANETMTNGPVKMRKLQNFCVCHRLYVLLQSLLWNKRIF